jgi:hypothetical protein
MPCKTVAVRIWFAAFVNLLVMIFSYGFGVSKMDQNLTFTVFDYFWVLNNPCCPLCHPAAC